MKNLKILIDNFFNKILTLNNQNSNLQDKLTSIDDLINNLIDHCIKKNIIFFIQNKINYTTIYNSFKLNLINFIKNIIDPDNNFISNYINDFYNNSDNFDNFSDINSLFLQKFKNNNTTDDQNDFYNKSYKVTFRDNVSFIYDNNMDDDVGFKFNYINNNNNLIDYNQENKYELALYIKILIAENKSFVEFNNKLISMCEILYNADCKFNIENPFT